MVLILIIFFFVCFVNCAEGKGGDKPRDPTPGTEYESSPAEPTPWLETIS